MFICYFITTVFLFGDQIFYSSTAYQTDFRNGTNYICRERNMIITCLSTIFLQDIKKIFF